MNEIESSLALSQAAGIGPVSFNTLVEKAGSARLVLELANEPGNPLALRDELLEELCHPDPAAIQKELFLAEQANCLILHQQDPRYPHLLRELRDAPPVLYIKGNPDCLQHRQLAIVGSRNPSVTGREHAHQFARSLALNGLVITSGLALGIDSAAHEGAISCKRATIAVMGTGLGHLYPRRNRSLADAILAHGGALVSEFPFLTGPSRENFPRRNRIISGMSLGTLVVEAARRSGSLITAKLAAEQGREVFAMPGALQNPLARGCHALIREGAKLVENTDDIFEELGAIARATPNQQSLFEENNPPQRLDKGCQTVLSCLGFEPTAIDTVVSRSGLTAASVSSMLLVLELQGFIQAQPGGLYSRIK